MQHNRIESIETQRDVRLRSNRSQIDQIIGLPQAKEHRLPRFKPRPPLKVPSVLRAPAKKSGEMVLDLSQDLSESKSTGLRRNEVVLEINRLCKFYPRFQKLTPSET